MRSAQLMLACYLFMASATSECGGDESCVAAEKDAAALLQSTVNIHGGPSGNPVEDAVVAEDDSNSKRVSPRAVQLVDEVSSCTDQRDDYMAKKGHQCDNWGYMYTNRCKHGDSGWQKNKWCQQSCWDNGAGYEGDNCGATSATSEAPLESLGTSGCTTSAKCGLCQGDCDNDDDCGDGLSCFQRSGFTQVPGCAKGGRGDKKHQDYCHLVEASGDGPDMTDTPPTDASQASGDGPDMTDTPPTDASQMKATGCTLMDQSGCTESSFCSWNSAGATCATACSMFGKSDCPGYCRYLGGGQGNKCIDVTTLDIGGESSEDTQQHHTAIAFRPEFATLERYDGTAWEPCAGDTDCWHGSDNGGVAKYRDMRVKLSSAHTKAAMDVQLTCDIIGTSKIIVTYGGLVNGDLQVTYNDRGQNKIWSKTGPGGKEQGYYEIAINSNDQSPILRVEFERDSGTEGEVDVKIEVTNQPLWFEKCMTSKSGHAQCLKVFSDQTFSGSDFALRTDHQKQKSCIEGGGTSDALCTAWYNCIDEDTREMIVKVVDAFDPQALLLQENLLQGSTARPWKESDGCTAGTHPDCQDPAGIDVEAFDCNCYQVLVGKSVEEIRAMACPASEKKVCCHWKTANCGAPPSLLLQEGNEDTHSQKTMTSRSQQNNSENGDSLDDSLSGKRECA